MRRSSRLATLIAALAVSALGLSACDDAPDGIRVATVGPISGQEAPFGEQMRRGMDMAVADLNAAGGVLGQQLVLETGDDACDPKQAVTVASQMVGRGVRFVAGHFCSSASIPARDVYAEGGVLMISPASTANAFTDEAATRGQTTVFRTCGRDDLQGVTAADYLRATFPEARIAVLDDKSSYGKGLADVVERALSDRGGQVVLRESYNKGDKDFSALISKMKDARADIIYLGGYHVEGGLIVRQAREQGLAATLVGADALVSEDFWNIAGPAGEGTLMTFAPDPRNNPEARAVVERFRAGGYNPEAYTLYSYAAVQAWAGAVAAAGTTDAAQVATALRATPWQTVIGTIAFDAKGDVVDPNYVMFIWRDGQYVQLDQPS